MSDTVIKIENLSKQYQLGMLNSGSVAQDINRFWAKIRGKEDPTLQIGGENILNSVDDKYVWALKDINVEIKQGEIVGVIGKNGAGKSTLLKILSKVTGPTTGSVKFNGRMASLLEVGTGFHPELTGKDNIYLNGAMLGMTKAEIKRKLDEIIQFAGIEKYINTPVKRYSSGMFVRLAFAVAAHLEPEILVVDEVLAVGDAEFQKKAIGKMQDVSRQGGRTVLFVSHNMASIMNLCTRAILLQNGQLIADGSVEKVIPEYLNSVKNTNAGRDLTDVVVREGNGKIEFTKYDITNSEGKSTENVICGQDFNIVLSFKVFDPFDYQTLHFSVKIIDDFDNALLHMSNSVSNGKEFKIKRELKDGQVICNVKNLPLQAGTYNFHLFVSDLQEVFDSISFAGKINVDAGDFFNSGKLPDGNLCKFLVKNKWEIIT